MRRRVLALGTCVIIGAMRVLMACCALFLGGCSSKTAPQDQRGPVWPDMRPDRPPRTDARDARNEAPLPDRPVTDLPPPDRWARDFRPEAAPAAWQKVGLLTAEDLHDAACVAGHVFAVGAQGTIQHKGPSDTTFAAQPPYAPTTDLHAVSFADVTLGMAAGNDSQLWQTKDLGTTWTIAPQGCGAFLFETVYGLHLSSTQEGLATGVASGGGGGGSKHFNAPGLSWICSLPLHAGETFYDVFRQGKYGWVVGDTAGKIYRSEDQGLSWTSVTAGTSNVLRAVFFPSSGIPSSGIGVAAGEAGTIVRSTDGTGNVWSPIALSPTTQALWDLFFWDAQSGWAVGAAGTILHTADGGVTWSAQKSGTTSRIEGVCFTSASEGWAVGQKGLLLHTSSGGQ